MNSLHKDLWRGALIFSLICVWTNGWVNNSDAGDLRCHAHYAITVMESCKVSTLCNMFSCGSVLADSIATSRQYLTHCDLVPPYGDIALGQHWLRLWLVAWGHGAITWANVDLSLNSRGFCSFHLGAISQKVLKIFIRKTASNISLFLDCCHITLTTIWMKRMDDFE